MLSRAEMKSVTGGESCPPGYNECEDGTCVIPGESCGSGGGIAGPKIEACRGKNRYDKCSWTWQGTPYTGCCDAHMASELYCSTLYTGCF